MFCIEEAQIKLSLEVDDDVVVLCATANGVKEQIAYFDKDGITMIPGSETHDLPVDEIGCLKVTYP